MNEPRKRTWLTIRLRTLLLIILAICCGLGWLGAQKRKSARNRQLAEELTRSGSSLGIEYCDFWGRKIAEPPPAWQRWLFGEHYFQQITSATINEPGMLPEKGRRLGELHDLKLLQLSGTTWGFTDQHAAALVPLRNLETLLVPRTRLTDQGLAAISPQVPLRVLDVSGNSVTDAGLAHLAQLPTLETLDLSETLVTDAGMKQLARFSRLKHLSLRRVMVSNEGVRELARCQALESVSLAELPLWPEAFAALAQAPKLRQVIVADSQIFEGESLRAMRDKQPVQEQAVFALGAPSVFWAFDREEGTCKLSYLRWLLEHGAEPNERTQDVLPLQWLVEQNALEPVHSLLEYGAQANLADRDGKKVLAIAAERGQTDMVRLLLAGGADPNLAWEALWAAAVHGRDDIARELLAHGADVKRSNGSGVTPLHIAAGGGHIEVVKLLLDHGADPAAKAANGETPSTYAQRIRSSQQAGSADIIKLLQAPAVSANPEPAPIPTVVERKTPKAPPLPAGATLKQAYERMTSGADHQPYLRALKDQFPEVDLTPPEAPAKWTLVTLNQEGARIDAIRFTSPMDQPADMRWCFINPNGCIDAWFIMPMKGAIPGFELYWAEAAIDTENLDEPATNHTIYQSLEGGQILPGEEYLLWFTFTDARPVDLHVAIKLSPASENARYGSGPEPIARDLGLRVPLRRHTPNSPESIVQRAIEISEYDVQTAAELVENGLKLAPDHRRLLQAASVFNRNNADRVAAIDREAAALIYQKAADQARTLAARHEELTFKERLALVEALLSEARAYTWREDGPRTIASVSEAFEAGFTDVPALQATEDFAFLKDNAEYIELFDRWRKLMAPLRAIDYEQRPHPADAVEFNGHWYKFYGGMLPWHLAQLRCKEQGGYLACVETEAESKFLQETWPKACYWLGGVLEDGMSWRWINGQPLNHAPWADGEPALRDGEQRLMVGSKGRWSAVAPVDERIVGYLCEWDQ